MVDVISTSQERHSVSRQKDKHFILSMVLLSSMMLNHSHTLNQQHVTHFQFQMLTATLVSLPL
jgi:hypothetical protein